MSKRHKSRGRGHAKKAAKKAGEGVVQDQIILASEIMSLILDQLDVRALKQVRLVCKSWLLEAQTHMRRRAIVWFEREGCTARIQSFLKVLRTKFLTLPNPFEYVDLDLYTLTNNLGHKGILSKFGSLRPPLVITRFNPALLSMKVAFPLIVQWSSTLEYLKLVASSCEADYLPPMDPEQIFPKLRHVHAEIPCESMSRELHGVQTTRVDWKHFPSIVAWIVNASPTLEAFKSTEISGSELANKLFLGIGIKNVKRLTLKHYRYEPGALRSYLSTPFSRLENLKIKLTTSPSVREAVAAAVNNSACTLKTLNLFKLDFFVFCPHVHDLTLLSIRDLKAFIPNPFPSLHVLKVTQFDADVTSDVWKELPPFVGLKTLRAVQINLLSTQKGCDKDELLIKFFEKFPSLERVHLFPDFLVRICKLKATEDARFSTLLESVRHLEISGRHMTREDRDYSALRFLTGIESVTMIKYAERMSWIPFRAMPNLKVVRFPWVNYRDCFPYIGLPSLARDIEKVFVTNCCSVRRDKSQSFKDLLKGFFDSVPNAQCGCNGN